jgi:hypothetical protein
MGCGEVPPIESPLSKTSENPDHVHTPAFRRRHVFVNVALGANTVPSGIDISLTNWAWSHTGVAENTGVDEGSASVGKDAGVFVTGGGGRVNVLNGVACVDMACTVNAAAVNTAFGSSVAGAREGRLHAESMNMMTAIIETIRAVFNILLLLIEWNNFTPRMLL